MATELTPAQRAFLRSSARILRPDMIVGKAGVDAGALGHVRRLLTQKELIKVRLLKAAGEDRAHLAEELARRTDAALVDVVGRVVVLYRRNPKLPADQRIDLPE